MDSLDEKLERLLADPNLEGKLSSLLNELGGEEPPPAADLPDLSALTSLFAAGNDGEKLLRALSPYLRPSRRKKLAQAEKLLTVCRLLPALTPRDDK